MVCDIVVLTVIVPLPEFFTTYNLPAIPTAVGSVTIKVPEVQSIK